MSAEPENSSASPRLLASSQWNLLGFLFMLLANLAAVPLVIRWIGIEAFGSAGVVVAICAPLTLVGTSIGTALVREMGSRIHAGDGNDGWRHVHAALRLGCAISIAGAVAIMTAGPWLGALMTRSGPSEPPSAMLFIPAGVGWFAQQCTTILQATLVARQDFRRLALMQALNALVTVSTTLSITLMMPNASGYLWSLAAGFWGSLTAWLILLRKGICKPPGPGLWIESVALLQFTRWQVVNQLAGSLANQIDRYMLGSIASFSVVGAYNAAKRLQESAGVGVVKVGEVLFPRFGAMSSVSTETRAGLYMRASWALTMFSAALLAPIAGLAEPAIAVWISPSTASIADSMLLYLSLAALIGSGSTVHFAHDLGRGRERVVAAVSVMHSVLTVLLTVPLIFWFGPVAAGAGLLGASLLRLVTTLWLARQLLQASAPWPDLLCSNLIPIGAGALVAIAVHSSQPTWIQSWTLLLAAGATVSLATIVLSMLLTAMSHAGRSLLREVIGSILVR